MIDPHVFLETRTRLCQYVQHKIYAIGGIPLTDIEIEEIADTTLDWVWKHRAAYDAERANLLSWSISILARYTLKEFSRKRRVTAELFEDSYIAPGHSTTGHSDAVFLAVKPHLTAIQYNYLYDHYYRELSTAEIAKAHDITPRAVRQSLSRTYAKLQSIFDLKTLEEIAHLGTGTI